MQEMTPNEKYGEEFVDVSPSYDYLKWDEYGDEFFGEFVEHCTDYEGKRAVLFADLEDNKKRYYLGNQEVLEKLLHAKPGNRYLISPGEKRPASGNRTFRRFTIQEPKGQSTPKPTLVEMLDFRKSLESERRGREGAGNENQKPS